MKDKGMEYKVISAFNNEHFNNQVTEALNSGYKLDGTHQCSLAYDRSFKKNELTILWSQAMVKEQSNDS